MNGTTADLQIEEHLHNLPFLTFVEFFSDSRQITNGESVVALRSGGTPSGAT